ncbi:bromodomain protein (macronuclear) [Tetrahymena thermophila SB210]|uniref:Bromodomain protein n=1 Tax=Tetrahymena thermophila (strain SB210) TaxID=312017 RepID=I7MDR9_TETTS|nr:bromodomain protein [Tetrahymena thermophila SB210]EAR90831.2 bromodomain protein [Tetrahymena thermophila SB210]|eukprot:XP_001011076.2 bromodomain protein [Tetrahymena thermophila SB210]
MQEEEIIMTKHVSSKGRVFFDNQNMVKQRLYFLIIQYLQQDEYFDRRLLEQIKGYAEANHLLGQLLAFDGSHVDATFDELNFQQKGSSCHSALFSKDENLNTILSIYQRFSAQRVKNQNKGIQNLFIQKMTKLSQMLNEPAMYIQPARDLFIKKKRQGKSLKNTDELSNDTFILRFQHLKTCFGHAYSADSGSINEESGEPYIPIYNTTFDKSGRLVITADEEGLIKIWSAENGLLLSNLKGHTSGILSNDISPCNKYLVTCSIDLTARVWDIFNQRCLTCFKSKEQLNAVVFYKYQNEFTEQLYLLMMSNVGNILIYKEDQFKENGGGINQNLQPVITLAMRKHKKMQESKIVDNDNKNEAVCIETHPSGYLVVGTETGEILVWEKIHTLENRNRQVLPFIEKKEHSKNCQLIKFSPNGEFMITASFDGYAKIWPWKKLIENDKRLSDQIFSIYFDNSNKCEKNCWNVAFSCKNRYAFATFTRKMKRTKEVETVVYVHELAEKKIKHEFTQQNTPARLQDHILVFEPHPTQENILLTADYAGQIIIYDVSLGCILNIFQERGYHIGYPNLEVPVLDGCWAPDGLKFVASTYYGSFSLYGYDCAEIYKTTPTEQFFANDTEIFIYSDNHVPLSTDDDVEINTKSRGKICDYQRIPYRFEYNNDLKKLKDRGYFEETSEMALKLIEDKISELKILENEQKEKDENFSENLVEKYLKNQEKEKHAYFALCNQLRDSYNNANATMEGSMRVDYNERMEILKKMSKEMQKRHSLDIKKTETKTDEDLFQQVIQQSQPRILQERQISDPAPAPLLRQESEQATLIQQRNNNRRRVIDDEDLDQGRSNTIPFGNQQLSRRPSQMPQPAALNNQNSRTGQRGRGRRPGGRQSNTNQVGFNDDFEDSMQSEEEIPSQDDSEVNFKDINEDDDEIQKDLLEEMEMFDDPLPRRTGGGFESNDRRNQSNNRNRSRGGRRIVADDYLDEEEEEKKDSSNQRRTRLKRFSNTTSNETRAQTISQQQTEGQQRQGTLRYNRNTRSSYSMQYTTGEDATLQSNAGYNSSQDYEGNTNTRLRRRNQHIIEEDNDDLYLDNNTNSNNHHSLRQNNSSHLQQSHNLAETRANAHQTRSSTATYQDSQNNTKTLRASSRNKKSKKNRQYNDGFNSNDSESEDRFSDEIMEEDDDEVDINYEDEDDYEYKLRKPKKSVGGAQSLSQNNQNSRQSGRSLRTSYTNRKKIQDSDEEEDELPKQKNRSSKKNGIVNDEDDNQVQNEHKNIEKHKIYDNDEDEEIDDFDEEDEEYTDKKKKNYLKKRTSSEAGIKKSGQSSNKLVKKIKTNDSDALNEDMASMPEDKKSLCQRCEQIIEGEAKSCNICKHAYHDEYCSKYRGCLKDKKYFCFDCYANNNTVRIQKDEQDKRTFSREYLERETNDPYQYIPQINDMCYYIFQAHEEYCEKYFEIFDYEPLIDRLQKENEKSLQNGNNKSTKKSIQRSSKLIDSGDEFQGDEHSSNFQKKGQTSQAQDYHILPFLSYKELYKPTLCQISSIEYSYPMLSTKKMQEKYRERPIFLLIQLKILETGEEFSVYFSNSQVQCGSFLIPQELYDQSICFQENLKVPQQLEFFYHNQVFSGQVVEVSPKEEYQKLNSEYLKLKVKLDTTDEKIIQKLKQNLEGPNMIRISCWDVIYPIRRTSSPDDYPNDDACLSKEETEQIFKLIQAVIDNQSEITCYFEEAVNLKKYKHYYEFVEFPMDISKIRRRLLNGYYRSQQSIFHDINLIDSNAHKFNNPDSPICESSKRVKEILTSIVSNFLNVEMCLSLAIKNKKNLIKTIQTLFPNYNTNSNQNNLSINNNNIQIKIPQQSQQSLIPVPIEKPHALINNPLLQAEQYQQKYPNSQVAYNAIQQQKPQQNYNQINNNFNQQNQQYQYNNSAYQNNSNSNDTYFNQQNANQNGQPYAVTGLINEPSNQYFNNQQSQINQDLNYNSQLYEPINNADNNYSQTNYNYEANQGYDINQNVNQDYQLNEFQSQNLGQQNVQQNIPNLQSQQQQRTTRSGRLTRNSSKFDYDQIDQRKN